MAKNPLPDVPTFCMTSESDYNIDKLDEVARLSMLAFAKYTTKETGFYSDGLVVPINAITPNSYATIIQDMDHAQPAMNTFGNFRFG